jgi:hypothetical protein
MIPEVIAVESELVTIAIALAAEPGGWGGDLQASHCVAGSTQGMIDRLSCAYSWRGSLYWLGKAW